MITRYKYEQGKNNGWLPSQDSNLGKRIQSPSCYHYTTRQFDFKVITEV